MTKFKKVHVVGLPLSEAIKLIQANGGSYRLTKVNGESMIVTMDFRPQRANLEVEDGIVVCQYWN